MSLDQYLDKLKTALLAYEGITAVDSSQTFLSDDTRRMVVDYANGRRATRFVSREDVANYQSFADGVDLERFVKVITFGLDTPKENE